ncbi:hypothetical protein TTHERM_00614850 (macronuclear) [Tetrahymena thermophila SB210]|uniref:Kinase domain protein n=1 Tax=Tetrahymena thermophila (strain SB210) TaxID=312017 RepID=I7LXD3_TETTS|nr:hypothetical protein TTHERM_00614850 [Tetrahymena thermophila SB210]EAS04409.2 hypothetical protein TTHERM_00614850 [Tetrahymena thermophila SB210]|eukprot:XP_001024654.2 hypothetical protein TTHERM_00614850 [Tetrahymena thermophila SB210]
MNEENFKKILRNYFQVHNKIQYFSDNFNEKCDEIWIGSRQNKSFQTKCKNTNNFNENLKNLIQDIDISDIPYYCSECLTEIENYFKSTTHIKIIRFFNLDSNMQANIIALEKIIYPQLNSQYFQYLSLKIKKFEGDSMKQLSLILNQSKYLQHISLYLEKASQPHQLENGLKNNKSLKSLYLDFGQMKLNSDQNLIQSAINGISQNDTLQTAYLNLSECDIQNVNIGKIFSKTSQLKTLILNLFSAETNSTSLKLFGMGMKQGKTIKHLFILLEKIYIRVGEAQEFSKGLQCLQNLKHLELTIRQNKMSDDNASIIAQSLQKIQNLQKIKLKLGPEFQNEPSHIISLLNNKSKIKEIQVKLPLLFIQEFCSELKFSQDEYLRVLSLKIRQSESFSKLLPSLLSSKINLQKLILKGFYEKFQQGEELGFQINKLQQLEHLVIKTYVMHLNCFQHIKQLPHLKYLKIEISNIQNSEKYIKYVEKLVNNCPLLDIIDIKISNYTIALEHQFCQITYGKIFTTNISNILCYIDNLVSKQKKLLKFEFPAMLYRLNNEQIVKVIQIIKKIVDSDSKIWYFDLSEIDRLQTLQGLKDISQGLKYEFYKIIAFNNEIRDQLVYNPFFIYYDLYT